MYFGNSRRSKAAELAAAFLRSEFNVTSPKGVAVKFPEDDAAGYE